MKNGKLAIGIILLVLMQLVACERNDVDITTDKVKSLKSIGLEASKETGIKQKEPVIFTIKGDLSVSNYSWKVTPMEYISINKGRESTTIIFGKAGKYTVIAQDSLTLDSMFIDVEVGSEIYEDTQEKIDIADIISLTPVIYPDSAYYLELLAQTKNTYSCSDNYLTSFTSNVENTCKIDFSGVTIPAGCIGEKSISKSKLIVSGIIKENKIYDLEIVLNGKSYKGSFERKGEKYQFTWPYTDGVIFTTKSL